MTPRGQVDSRALAIWIGFGFAGTLMLINLVRQIWAVL